MMKLNRKPISDDGMPRAGSQLREIYDLFKANKGKIIDFSSYKIKNNNAIKQLTDYYGCDIRPIATGRWMMAGEYIDNKYVSYFEP